MTTTSKGDKEIYLKPSDRSKLTKPIIVFASIMAVVGVLVLLTWQTDINPADLQVIMSKRVELARLCSSTKPDFALIEKVYKKGSQKVSKWVDDKFDIEMDGKILDSNKELIELKSEEDF